MFRVMIDDCVVRECEDEIDAHHWCKHAFEAVQQGCSTPSDIARGMAELCRQATAFHLHD